MGQNSHLPALFRSHKFQLGQVLYRQLADFVPLGGDAEQISCQFSVPNGVQIFSQTSGQLIAGFGLEGALGFVAVQHQGFKGLRGSEGKGVNRFLSHHQQAGIGEQIVHSVQSGQILFCRFQGFRRCQGIFNAVSLFGRSSCVLSLL